MPKYEVVPATREHIAAMVPHMRQADIEEVYAACGEPIGRALYRSLALSSHCWTGIIDGQPACMFGVAPINMLAGRGAPWMLGTHLIEDHATVFLRRSRRYILTMVRLYNHLENYVDARNAKSIQWLAWLGFKFDEPAPYGKLGLPFMRFEMRI